MFSLSQQRTTDFLIWIWPWYNQCYNMWNLYQKFLLGRGAAISSIVQIFLFSPLRDTGTESHPQKAHVLVNNIKG